MTFYASGATDARIGRNEMKEAVHSVLRSLGPKSRVLAIPPDFTRVHSQAGPLTEFCWEYYGGRLTDVLPAIGTHYPMTEEERKSMFGAVPKNLFRVHDWRNGLATLGEVPAAFVRTVSEGSVEYPVPIQVDRLIADGGFDLILSIGQVVPHEVIGMANYNKNIFVGTGGAAGINKTHFLGAAYGMERIMGRADTPVRRVLNYGSENFARHLPIVYILTVIGKDATGDLVVRGLYVGDDIDCFNQAAALSLLVNFQLLDAPLKKVVVYLDPAEFKSTWLGNKAIYRTRMAIADGGELIILAPGLAQFGEDSGIDALIRKFGYVGTPNVLKHVAKSPELAGSLGAAAHLIHGSTEGRFSVTYCPGHLSEKEIRSVNFGYADLGGMLERYSPDRLRDGMNTLADGESIFYISNPALGLWAYKERFGMA
jgi:nickel-dependent lactate racemase